MACVFHYIFNLESFPQWSNLVIPAAVLTILSQLLPNVGCLLSLIPQGSTYGVSYQVTERRPSSDVLKRDLSSFALDSETTFLHVELRPVTGPFSKPRITRVYMEQRWNDTDRGKRKDHLKYHMDCPR
jgi:hypothetical protein